MPRLTEAERARLARVEERGLSPEEFAARIASPMSDFERESFDNLITWFARRYPSAGDRMRAIRLRMQRPRQRTG